MTLNAFRVTVDAGASFSGVLAAADHWAAALRARSKSRTTTALMAPSMASIRAMAVSVRSTDEACLVRLRRLVANLRPDSAAPPVPVTYVVNLQDRPVPPALQEEMASRLPGEPTVIRIESGHVPAVTMPVEFAALVHSAVRG